MFPLGSHQAPLLSLIMRDARSGLQGYLAHKKQHPPRLATYGGTKPRALWCPWGGGLFLMSEAPL